MPCGLCSVVQALYMLYVTQYNVVLTHDESAVFCYFFVTKDNDGLSAASERMSGCCCAHAVEV
jgi:hypothetical protein